jgi:hypothetical protein
MSVGCLVGLFAGSFDLFGWFVCWFLNWKKEVRPINFYFFKIKIEHFNSNLGILTSLQIDWWSIITTQ